MTEPAKEAPASGMPKPSSISLDNCNPAKRRELFERIAARSLATLDEGFPGPIALRPRDLLAVESVEPTSDTLAVCDQTLQWLWDEGFFRSPNGLIISGTGEMMQNIHPVATLTAKGLNALNANIEVGGERGRAGKLLTEQLSESGKDARAAMISEIVGRIISAAVKGFLGH
jgi:hypothetical protein